MVSTLAGQAGVTGSSNGVASNSMFSQPLGIAMDAACTFAVLVRREGRGGISRSITRLGWRSGRGHSPLKSYTSAAGLVTRMCINGWALCLNYKFANCVFQTPPLTLLFTPLHCRLTLATTASATSSCPLAWSPHLRVKWGWRGLPMESQRTLCSTSPMPSHWMPRAHSQS